MGKSTVQWTSYQLSKMKEQFNFELPFQRKFVRRKDRAWKSLLVHTMMIDGYIPNLLVWKNGDTCGVNGKNQPKFVYHAVDCLQRMNTLYQFLNDEFALADDTPLVEKTNVSGLKCSELPEDIKQAVMGFSFAVTIFDESYSYEDIEEIFYRVNQTKPLSDIEQSQVLLGERNRSFLIRITESELFKRINFTSTDIEGYVDRKTVVQIMALLSGKNMSFSGADIKAYMREIGKKPIDADLIAEIDVSTDYLIEAFKSWTTKMFKSLKKSVVPSLYITARHAQDMELPAETFGEWAKLFLIEEYSRDSEFGETLSKKTANREIIQRRTELMLQSMKSFDYQISI